MIQKRASETIQKMLSVGHRHPYSTSELSSSLRTPTRLAGHSHPNPHQRSCSNSTSMTTRSHFHQMNQCRSLTLTSNATTTANVNATASVASSLKPFHSPPKQFFHTESEYHNQADDTLHLIQDTLEYYFEDNIATDVSASMAGSEGGFEINFASGVLTISLPSHGTWVLNKQTPNEQIWWSSPISGPRRYEWDETQQKWVWTRYVDYCQQQKQHQHNDKDAGKGWDDTKSLGEALKIEMISLLQVEHGLEDLNDL
mmetsp:Transcript_16732/g.19359  ORF Transcript_16732/g.19359 Transcript_16732/m.19359 type:complete len:256 (+) Transcript_16732:136-903(+)